MPLSNEQKEAYYKVLDVPKNATDDELKAAYKKMALKWHPDRHLHDKENATEKFVEVNDAYRALTRKRHHHPEHVDHAHGAAAPPARPSGPAPHPDAVSASSVASGSTTFRQPSQDSFVTTPPASPKPSVNIFPKQADRSASPHHHSEAGSRTSEKSRTTGSGPHGEVCHGTTGSSDPRTTPPSSTKLDSNATKWTTPKYPRARLRKQSKPAMRRQNPPEPGYKGTPKSNTRPLNKSSTKPPAKSPPAKADHEHSPHESHSHLRDYPPPLFSRGQGTSKEWVYSLQLTLEELFTGKHCRFRLTRYLLSNKKKQIILDVDVPSGCRPGTRILCRGVGHERKDGTFQDVAFIIEEAPHERFARIGDNLVMEIKLPWVQSLETEVGELTFGGLDGATHLLEINYPKHKAMAGSHTIVGAGMPIRHDGKVVGRGDLVVKWEIFQTHASKWQTLKKVLHFTR